MKPPDDVPDDVTVTGGPSPSLVRRVWHALWAWILALHWTDA